MGLVGKNVVTIFVLLVALPLLHTAFISGITNLGEVHPRGIEIFFLFTLPVWVASIIIYSLELSRKNLLQKKTESRNGFILGLLGMTGSCIAIIISPIRGDIGLMNYIISGSSAFILGTLGGIAYVQIVYLRK